MKLLVTYVSLIASSALAQLPSSQAGKSASPKFESIESIAAVIPVTVDLKTSGKWNVVAVEQANTAVTANAQDQLATLRLKVDVFEPYKENGWGYRIMAPVDTVSVRGTRLPYKIWVYFRPDQSDALAKVRKGSTLTLTGVLGRADVKMYGDQPTLCVDLTGAKVEKP